MKAGKILPRKNARNTEKKAESGNPPPLRFGATRAETNKTGSGSGIQREGAKARPSTRRALRRTGRRKEKAKHFNRR